MADNWTGASVASSFKHKIFYFLIKTGGRYCAYLLLYFVVASYAIVPKFRRKAYPYIEKRFGKLNFFSKFWHCYKLFLSFGKTLVDKAVFGILGKIEILSSQQDRDLCTDLYNQGKGLIFITAHCGAWQSAMAAFDFIKADKYVLYKRVKEDVDKQVYEHGNRKQNIKFIDPTGPYGGTVEMLSVLQKKSIVCVMGDRTFGSQKNEISVNFLGHTINVPGTIYRIASITQTPIVIVFFPTKSDGKFDSMILDNFVVEDNGAKITNYKEYAEKFVNALEQFTKQYPYQFFNMYDMWNENDKLKD